MFYEYLILTIFVELHTYFGILFLIHKQVYIYIYISVRVCFQLNFFSSIQITPSSRITSLSRLVTSVRPMGYLKKESSRETILK